MLASRFCRRLGIGVAFGLSAVGLHAGIASAASHGIVTKSDTVAHRHTFALGRGVEHFAVYWRGHASARVRVALSRDGRRFGAPHRVLRDETGEQARNGETYGAVMATRGARFVRVSTNQPLRRLSVTGFTDGGSAAASRASAVVTSIGQPTVIPRSGWGADESLRFDSNGNEIWPPAFYPVQKVIVHHTATQNDDPDPAATIRAIYRYHAVTQGWGDIGYNFLIDESGRIYEGRYSRQYAPGESPTGEDLNGNGVTAAHTQGYNSGTVGIALLGTLTNQDASPAARSALEQLIAWIDGSHGIDPQGASLYTNPVSRTQATFPNIAGHRDLAATECPGGAFYATLPTIRSDVAALISGGSPQPDFALGASPATLSVVRGSTATYSVVVTPVNGFSAGVSLRATGVPAGATASFSPNPATSSSTLTVRTTSTTKTGTFTITVTGSSGTLSHSTTVTLQVRRK